MLKGKIKETSDRTVWAEFKPGFQVEIRYTPRGRVQQLYEKCRRREWDPKTHVPKESLDQGQFYQIVGEEIIVGWRGLTPDTLRKIVDMENYPEGEVPYSAEDAAELLAKVYDFDAWVQQVSIDLEYFEAARRAAETKNS